MLPSWPGSGGVGSSSRSWSSPLSQTGDYHLGGGSSSGKARNWSLRIPPWYLFPALLTSPCCSCHWTGQWGWQFQSQELGLRKLSLSLLPPTPSFTLLHLPPAARLARRSWPDLELGPRKLFLRHQDNVFHTSPEQRLPHLFHFLPWLVWQGLRERIFIHSAFNIYSFFAFEFLITSNRMQIILQCISGHLGNYMYIT